jgi:hypothetical protein
MKAKRLVPVIIVAVLFSVCASMVFAEPSIPHSFYGTVLIDGEMAPVGTEVEARGEGVITGVPGNPVVTTEAGQYGSAGPLGEKLIVQGGIAAGAALTFYIDGEPADQTCEWYSGDYTRLDLTITTSLIPSIHLSQGWNLLSTPIALDQSCDTWGEFVAMGDGLDIDPESISYYFDSSAQIWGQVLADYPLKPCDAIYVKMASADTATIVPSSLPSIPSKGLYLGWNLVSLAALEDMGVIQAMASIYLVTGDLTGYSHVVSPATGQPGWVHDRDGVDNPLMLPAKGYWVFMVNEGTLAGFTFTPW